MTLFEDKDTLFDNEISIIKENVGGFTVYSPSWSTVQGWWDGKGLTMKSSKRKYFATAQEAYTDFIENYVEE